MTKGTYIAGIALLLTASVHADPVATMYVRPTWYQAEPIFRMENSAELGAKLNKSVTLSYNQDFFMSEAERYGPTLFDGYAKLKIMNIRESRDKLLSFSSITRVYAPTDPAKRDAGMITMVRNYFLFTRKLSDGLTFNFYEVPILHVYDGDGAFNTKNEPVANPIFENRVILEPVVDFGGGVTLSMPLNFYVVRYRDFREDAKLNDDWRTVLTFAPYLEWNITKPITLGALYETGSLTSQSDLGLVWTDGQKAGYYQIYLKVSF